MNSSVQSTQTPKAIGAKGLLTQLKIIATVNRVNEMYVVGEYKVNRFNPVSSDFHIRGVWSVDNKNRLTIPQSVSKVAYHVTRDVQPEWKLYRYKTNPVEFKPDEAEAANIVRELSEGQYGEYYRYTWKDVTYDSFLKQLGDVEL